MEGLKKLEYRGYDSAGIAVFNPEQHLDIIKTKGRLSALEKLVQEQNPQGNSGIAHTRWATHGEPSIANAHPQCNTNRTIAVVHNGIIENHTELRKRLAMSGYCFSSQTDTEVIAHLIDHHYQKEKEPLRAIRAALQELTGSYALGIVFDSHPNTVFAARKDSPLAVGIGQNGNFIVSDASAILKHTRNVIYLENFELAAICPNSVKIYNLALQEIPKKAVRIEWEIDAAEKNGFAHFMLKEIHEQPTAIRNTLSPRIVNGMVDLSELKLSFQAIKTLEKIHIVACGSAYHAGIVGKYVMEQLAKIPVEVDLASEFRYRNPILAKDSICIVISQSGETADTLAALREAKRQNIHTVAIVNVIGSSIAREADSVILTHAGPEISVATTKAYSAQLAVLYLIALHLSLARGNISHQDFSQYLTELESIPEKITQILQKQESIRQLALQYATEQDVFFIGRGIDHAAALEAALKLKEISYIHAEAYAAGELKHGTISLIEKGSFVVSLATQPHLYEKMLSNTAEVICRGATVFTITPQENPFLSQNVQNTFILPTVEPLFAASLSAVPLQLFAYYVALAKQLDIDKPRNLAKSVTVE